MLTFCTALLIAAAAQANAADAVTYEVRYQGDSLYGFVSELAGGQMIRFEEDAPWKDNPVSRSFRADQVEYFQESSSHRANRRHAGWESRGYTNVARGDAPERWVPREEAERAARALEMVAALDFPAPDAPPPAPAADGGLAMGDANPSAAGWLAFWPHAAVVAFGGLLLILVARAFIL